MKGTAQGRVNKLKIFVSLPYIYIYIFSFSVVIGFCPPLYFEFSVVTFGCLFLDLPVSKLQGGLVWGSTSKRFEAIGGIFLLCWTPNIDGVILGMQEQWSEAEQPIGETLPEGGKRFRVNNRPRRRDRPPHRRLE